MKYPFLNIVSLMQRVTIATLFGVCSLNFAYAAEFGVGAVAVEGLIDVGISQVDPADDAFDGGRVLGVGEEEVVLLEDGLRLDGNDAVDAGFGDEGFELGRTEVVLEGVHALADPVVGFRGVVPEVVMGVDAHL